MTFPFDPVDREKAARWPQDRRTERSSPSNTFVNYNELSAALGREPTQARNGRGAFDSEYDEHFRAVKTRK